VAGQTPRFGLNFFGGDTAGTFDEDNEKYTGEDRLTLDRLLAALENHNHRVPASLDEPDGDLTLDLLSGQGSLDSGTTYYYVVSFVNSDGLETVTGPEASVDTLDLLPAPDAPQGETSTAAGSLTPGQYYYALSGLRGTEESPLGEASAFTVVSGEHVVTLTLPDLGDATSYQVWRMKDTDPGWTRVAISATGSAVDNGSIPASLFGDPANIPPTATTGIARNAVRITLTGPDVASLTTISGWRIYRSTISGVYGSTSLVHEVIERTDETVTTSPLVTTWLDDGDVTLTGSPKLFSNELMVPAFTFEANDPMPAAAGYPQNYPMLDGAGVLNIARSGVWTPVSGARGVAFFTGTGNPTGNEPPGAVAGDVFLDIASGDLYLLNGS
jgi:hypothetical protein